MSESHYKIILELLADKLQKQKEEIEFKQLRIEMLERQLQEAEQHTNHERGTEE